MLNNVVLVGRVGKTPEGRMTARGTDVATFPIAVEDYNRNGEDWDKVTYWFDCTAFGKTAQNVLKYIDKGHKVTVGGKLRYQSWEKDGYKRSRVDVVVNTVEFMSKASDGSSADRDKPSGDSGAVYDDDIPF